MTCRCLQDVRRQLALTEDEKMDPIESVEGEAYTVKLQYIANVQRGRLGHHPTQLHHYPAGHRMADGGMAVCYNSWNVCCLTVTIAVDSSTALSDSYARAIRCYLR